MLYLSRRISDSTMKLLPTNGGVLSPPAWPQNACLVVDRARQDRGDGMFMLQNLARGSSLLSLQDEKRMKKKDSQCRDHCKCVSLWNADLN